MVLGLVLVLVWVDGVGIGVVAGVDTGVIAGVGVEIGVDSHVGAGIGVAVVFWRWSEKRCSSYNT